jgi:putative addiction module component (TIGR02574 family)
MRAAGGRYGSSLRSHPNVIARSRSPRYACGDTLVSGPRVSHLPFMAATPLLQQILELSAAQRLQLVEDIWDSLAQSEANVPVPQWHREELDRRLADPAEDATES